MPNDFHNSRRSRSLWKTGPRPPPPFPTTTALRRRRTTNPCTGGRQTRCSLRSSKMVFLDTHSPDPGTVQDARFRVAEGAPLWWNPKCPELAGLWETSVTLSSGFYQEIAKRPVPIDFRTLKALRSPLAMDIYGWLTYRMSYLERPSKTIPWRALQSQFGCDYTRTHTFKERFVDKVRQVLLLYPEARLTIRRSGIILRPSPTHITPASR
ncbi:MAG: replication protein RepA [Thermoanaerobaculia bacterium]